jgi:hypothetical protein
MTTAQKTWVAGDVLSAADMNTYARGGQEMGYVIASVDTSGAMAAATDLTGLTLTWTAISTRVYELEAFVNVSTTVAGDNVIIQITDNAGTNQKSGVADMNAASRTQTIITKVRLTGLTGSVTYKVRGLRNAGTGTITTSGTGTFASYFTVKDVGAN